MPYQSSLEERLKKRDGISAVWPWRIFLFALILFILSAAAYVGVAFSFKPYLKYRVKEAEKEIANLNQSIDESRQNRLSSVYSQFLNIKNIIGSHTATSKIFNFLEKSTYPAIYYSNMSFSASESDVRLDGAAPDFETLAKELNLLNNSPELAKVFLENSSAVDLGKGFKEIKFKIRLVFKPEYLKF